MGTNNCENTTRMCGGVQMEVLHGMERAVDCMLTAFALNKIHMSREETERKLKEIEHQPE